jgi:glycosyltransferase involved in cell wall biosynthesis
MISATSALPAIEAVAAGVPVIASSVGSMPEAVGAAGLLVRPRDERRLAAALATAWADDAVHHRLSAAGRVADGPDGPRTWADVATETRTIYASAVRSALAEEERPG